MAVYLLLSLAGGAFVAAPFLLLYSLKLPKAPKERVADLLRRLSSGPIAHRGGQPENTLAAFEKAKKRRASAVEVDLEVTKDGHGVLIHDSSVDRTSNGTGLVRNLTLQDLKILDFGSHWSEEFVGEKIPTLMEAVNKCRELELHMFLEIKTPKSVEMVIRLFSTQPGLYHHVTVISFLPHVIYRIRKGDPKITTGLVKRTNVLSTRPDGSRRNKELWKHLLAIPLDLLLTWSLETWVWRLLGASLLLAHKNDILKNRLNVSQWEERGFCVVAWTVNSKEEKDYFKNVLKLPILTDSVAHDSTAPEQHC